LVEVEKYAGRQTGRPEGKQAIILAGELAERMWKGYK
jgi:hypothetical protein